MSRVLPYEVRICRNGVGVGGRGLRQRALDHRLVYRICWDLTERREKLAGFVSKLVFPSLQGGERRVFQLRIPAEGPVLGNC